MRDFRVLWCMVASTCPSSAHSCTAFCNCGCSGKETNGPLRLGENQRRNILSQMTCKLLLALCAPHLLIFRLHFEKQSKKLQSSSPVQFCSRMSLILGSKKAISTSMATTYGSKQAIKTGRAQAGDRAEQAFFCCFLWEMLCREHSRELGSQ